MVSIGAARADDSRTRDDSRSLENVERPINQFRDNERHAAGQGQIRPGRPIGQAQADEHSDQNLMADFTLGKITENQHKTGDDGHRVKRPARHNPQMTAQLKVQLRTEPAEYK